MGGHVFVVQSNLLKLACDDILLPTDVNCWVTPAWSGLPVRPDPPIDWGDDGVRVTGLQNLDTGVRVRWVNTGSEASQADVGWLRKGIGQGLRAVADQRPSAAFRHGRRKQLVGIPAFGTGAGGFDHIRGKALDGLLDECIDAADQDDLDIAITTWHRADYSALQARRRQRPASHLALSQQLTDSADSLGRLATDGQLAWFLGAGISRPAGLPGWKSLIEGLAAKSQVYSGQADQLAEIAAPDAAMLLEREDPQAFRAHLSELLTVPHHALGHALLASLRPAEVITTNFDRLFEQAAERPFHDRSLAVLPLHRGPVGQPWLLKMHGDLKEQIVLSRDEFLGYDATWRPLASMVQTAMLTRHMVFVGYSLADENFVRLGRDVSRLLRSMKQRDPVGTFLTLVSDPLRSILWGEDFTEIAMAETEDEAGRILEIFLDRVGMAVAGGESSHLLDERYRTLVENDDRDLVQQLRTVANLLRQHQEAAGPGPWDALYRAFRSHGSD